MGNVGMGCFLCLTLLHALLKFLCLVYLLFTFHLFQWLGNAVVAGLFCIWSWLCEDHWIFISLFSCGDTAPVCITGRFWVLLLCVNAGSRAQCSPDRVGSHHVLFAALSIASAAQSCQGSLRALKCGRSRTERQQEEVLGEAAPEGAVFFLHHKDYQRSSMEYILLHGCAAKPFHF